MRGRQGEADRRASLLSHTLLSLAQDFHQLGVGGGGAGQAVKDHCHAWPQQQAHRAPPCQGMCNDAQVRPSWHAPEEPALAAPCRPAITDCRPRGTQCCSTWRRAATSLAARSCRAGMAQEAQCEGRDNERSSVLTALLPPRALLMAAPHLLCQHAVLVQAEVRQVERGVGGFACSGWGQ
jgi:hypothetical protein